MALIKCTECGKKVSDTAAACPSCGHPIEAIIKETVAKQEEQKIKKENKKLAKQERKNISPEQKKKNSYVFISIVGAIVVAAILIWVFGIKIPKDKAYVEYQTVVSTCNETIDEYNQEAASYNEKARQAIAEINNLDSAIDEAQDVIDCGEIPYEAKKMTTLSNTLKEARNNKATLPGLYELSNSITLDETLKSTYAKVINEAITVLEASNESIIETRDKLAADTTNIMIPNYSELLSTISTQKQALEDSYTIQLKITAPTEEFVIERLNQVASVANIAAVTEENDPNGNLGKAGGYTAQVFFSSPLLRTETIAGNSLINRGTDAGGSIEVYATVEAAEDRNTYLAAFDGTIFDSGAHKVVGTMIVRVSTNLTASKQELLMNEIINALIAP